MEENDVYFLRLANQSDAKSIMNSSKPSKKISPIKPTDSTINSINIVFLVCALQKKKPFAKRNKTFVAKGLDIYFDEPNRFRPKRLY